MFTRPDDLSDQQVVDALGAAWDLVVDWIDYAPVGFGSYHWWATADGERWFITVDDLEKRTRHQTEPLGEPLRRLSAALSTACSLRDSGMRFVIAPRRTASGAVACVVHDHFAVALYPFVEGTSSSWGAYPTRAERLAVLDLIAALHRAPNSARQAALVDDHNVPRRDQLVGALSDLGGTWDRGPFAEPARALLERHAEPVQRVLQHYDNLAAAVARHPERMVLTHGEPHRGNTIVTATGLVVIDWDTTLIAPPERDLWALVGEDDRIAEDYTTRTGIATSDDALELYRLWWDLAEIATYIGEFRRSHREDEDSRVAWDGLNRYLDPTRWPELV